MEGYIYVVFGVILISIGNTIGEMFNRRVGTPIPYCYTLILSATSFLFYLFYGGFQYTFDTLTFFMGLIFGVLFFLAFILHLKAIKIGYVSLTSLITSYAFILPVLFSIVFYQIYPSWLFYVGLGILMFAVVLIAKKQDADSGSKRITLTWLLLCLSIFFISGIGSIMQTYQQKMTNGNFKSEYMLTGMAVVVILSITWLFFEKKEAKQKIIMNIRKGWLPAAICGLSNALLNLCFMYALGLISPSLIFPIVNGGGLFLSYGLSVILYKEKLNLPQVIGFVLGIISIAIMNT